MRLINRIIFIVLIGFTFLNKENCFAGTEPYENFLRPVLHVNDTLTVKDKMFQNPSVAWGSINNIAVKDAITLQVIDSALITYSFTDTVKLRVYTYTDPSQTTPHDSTTVTLFVSYSPAHGTTYKGMDTYSFSGAYKVFFKILSISNTVGAGGMPFYQLTSRITINRKYAFSPATPIGILGVVSGSTSGSGKYLSLIWSPPTVANISGAEEYDLEWTTVDSLSDNYLLATQMAANITVSATALDQLFRNNATRVTTPLNGYNISLMYNDKYIVVRIRQVQYTTTGLRNEGDWNYRLAGSTGYAIWNLSWNEANLNWQYSSAFAEEGKKKEVVSYFDGTLRGRQTVTINNSDNIALVQENVYDDFGRATASILPAPFKDSTVAIPVLHYIINFNRNTAGTSYNFTNVKGTAISAACEFNPDSLNAGWGASRYYSRFNPFVADSTQKFNKYIPDAGGFPLSVTQYTADNTGRIKVQGGVGITFQPGKIAPSKTTRYYYAKPEQWELDQLFGNDVGYAEHYLKNMVIDANQQISISYLNASGKTIATALTGKAPDNLDTLTSYTKKKKQNIHLLNPTQFTYNSSAMTLSASTAYMASVTDTTVLKYDIQKLIDNYPGGSFHICSNCYYELSIKVFDDCNDVVYSNASPIQIGSVTPDSTNTGTYRDSVSFPINQVGEYHITFSFAFNNNVIENYVDNFVSKGTANGYLRKEFSFIQPYLDKLDYSGCLGDCVNSLNILGTRDAFTAMFTGKLRELKVDSLTLISSAYNTWLNRKYDSLLVIATAIHNSCTPTPCDNVRQEMLADVSPGGQYALFNGTTPLETDINVISINFKTTVFNNRSASDSLYQQNLITLPDGTVTSPYDAGFTLPMLLTYWQPKWAELFLPYHPEYCKLLFCYANSDYESWDQTVQQTINTASQIPNIVVPSGVATLHYSLTNAADYLLNADAFFATGGPAHRYYNQMRNDLLYYSSNVLNVASGPPVKSLTQFVDFGLYCADNTRTWTTNTSYASTDTWTNCTPDTACRVPDREWNNYKTFYFQLKDKFYKLLRDSTCGTTCPIGIPLGYNLPGTGVNCPAITDFGVELYNVADSTQTPACDSAHQTVALRYLPGNVVNATTVTLYYPSGFDATGLPTSFSFAVGDSVQTFCVPNSLPVSSIHVVSVNCEVSGGGSTPALARGGHADVLGGGDGGDGGGTSGGSGGGDTGTYIVNNGGHKDYCPANQFLIGDAGACDDDVTGPGEAFTIWIDPSTGQPNCTRTGQTAAVKIVQSDGYVLYYVDVPFSSAYGFSTVCLPNSILLTNGTVYVEVCGVLNPCDTFITPTTCPAEYVYKTSRFDQTIQNTSVPPTAASAIAAAQDTINQIITTNCEAQADSWMAALNRGLDQYADSTAKKRALRDSLIAICELGGDTTHLMGASIAGGRSFGHALMSVTGISTYTTWLNPWLISSPYPYSPKAQLVDQTISVTNAGICAKLNALNADYTASGSTAGLYNWLSTKYGSAMTLTATQFAEVQKACTNCKFLIAEDVPLPVFMDPNATGCVLPSAFNTAESDLNTAFAGGLSTTDTLYRTIYENFMNQRWGFTLSYDDYQAYKTKLTTQPTAILCNTPEFSGSITDPYACIETQITTAVFNGRRDYNNYIDEQKRLFRLSYINTCSAAQANVNMTANQQEYHYTLYYYDQADNLIRTIPPEGVNLLTSTQTQWVALARAGDSTNCSPPPYEPTMNADTTVAFNALSHTLIDSTSTQAVEMWLYNSGSPINQLIEQTPDRQFLFQAAIRNNRMQVEIYKATHNNTGYIKYTLSNRATMDISAQVPLNPWVHIVIQSSNFRKGTLNIYLNGILQTQLTGVQHELAAFKVKATHGIPVSYPANYSTLKHLRLYNRAMTTGEIATNAKSNCLLPSDTTAMLWYRFNVPAAGSITTINDTSTYETRLTPVYPNHTLRTTYVYNSTNQVNQQQSPDGGTNRFWYDLLSRLAVSQNDKQKPDSDYSYTNYDPLGRIAEVGQKHGNTGTSALYHYIGTNPDYVDTTSVNNFLTAGTNNQITHTYYDYQPAATGGIHALTQNNLRKRVALSTYKENQADTVMHATYYNYDLDGNVKTLYQQIAGLGIKQIDYEYDLISGKVNFVRYQDGRKDQFYYKYDYDADNRLTDAWSGTSAIVDTLNGSIILPENKKLDASYRYYLHGPLARMELGDQYSKVQGIDYAYTLQGWLKGVNGNLLNPNTEIGHDGQIGNNNNVAQDVYAYSLSYHYTDYKPISTGAIALNLNFQQTTGDITGQSLYNGNIANTTLAISTLNSGNPVGYSYHYDQLNRLKQTRQHNGISGTTWNSSSITNAYAESYSYDGNGNLLTQKRDGSSTTSTTPVDNLTYNHNYTNGHLSDNKLNSLQNGTSNYTYTYDQIGERTSDSKNGLTSIDWTVYGKIQSVTGSTNLTYTYNTAGQRITKSVTGGTTTYYVRDAQGNTLALYDNAGGLYNWREQYLYGSTRIGIWTPGDWRIVGNKAFELTDHRGNVLLTISDRRVQHSTNGTTVDYLMADVLTSSDTYSFGLPQMGRQYGAAQEYGYNGKENDNDIGNYQNYGMREYDLYADVFGSVDPIAAKYPELSTYQFASNTPIDAIDLDGAERYNYNIVFDKGGKASLAFVNKEDIIDNSIKFSSTIPYVKLIEKVNQEQEFVIHGEVRRFFDVRGTIIFYTDKDEETFNTLAEAKQYVKKNNGIAFNEFSVSHQLAQGADYVGENAAAGEWFGGTSAYTPTAPVIDPGQIDEWNGPLDYSIFPDPENVKEGGNFSIKQLKQAKVYNEQMNGGVLRSDEDGTVMNPSKRNIKGQKADMNQVEGDHKTAKAKRGTNSNKNLRLINKRQNLKKGGS